MRVLCYESADMASLRGILGRGVTPGDEELPVYMHPTEFAQLLAIVETLGPRRVWEWGSGGSTKALLRHCPYIERYVSIEHHPAWFARVKELVKDPRLELNLIEGTQPEPAKPTRSWQKDHDFQAWVQRCEQDPSIMHDYVEYPRSLETQFDLVLVDGRARNQCFRVGYELLRNGGVLVVHDAQRTEYHQTLRELGRAVFIEPWQQGQICVLRKPDLTH